MSYDGLPAVLCGLSDCIVPTGRWTRSQVACLYRPVCTDCCARPGVYFDGTEWRMVAHEPRLSAAEQSCPRDERTPVV